MYYFKHMLKKIKEVTKNKDFINFLKSLSIFIILLLLETTIFTLLIDFTGLNLRKIYIFTEVHFIFFLFILIFIIISFRDFLKIRYLKEFDPQRIIFFLIINLLSLFTFYKLNQYFMNNPQFIHQNALIFIPLWYLNALIILFSLLFMVFDTEFLKYAYQQFKNKLFISLIISFIAYFFIKNFLKLWPLFSKIVARTVFFMLKLVNPHSFYKLSHNIPTIGTSKFSVQIFKACSGIEGMALFLILFFIIILPDHKKINFKKVLLLYPLGLLGAFLINVLRTFSILIVGHYISPEFALKAFHSNIGWITFTIYFLIFIYFAYPWIKD